MRKQIIGFEDYWIDTEGKVWSMKFGKVKERKPVKHKDGYFQINLRKDGKVKNLLIHRLVAIAFIPNPKNYTQVNHLNGIKTDNKLENLEWCNNSMNQKHAFRIGKQNNKGSKHPQVKLSDEEAIEIFQRLNNGQSPTEIAKDYPITRQAIYEMKHGRSWTHLKY